MVAVDTIVQALDNKLCSCVAFLDLGKAFDSLDHHILLQRLGDWGWDFVVYKLATYLIVFSV